MLLHEVLHGIKARDLLIDDRNFCTLAFLFGLMHRKAYFITRQHGRMPVEYEGKTPIHWSDRRRKCLRTSR